MSLVSHPPTIQHSDEPGFVLKISVGHHGLPEALSSPGGEAPVPQLSLQGMFSSLNCLSGPPLNPLQFVHFSV